MPINDPQVALDAICDHFTTLWNAQATPPELRYWDVHYDAQPNGDDAWARLTVHLNDADQVTLGEPGARRFTRYGLVSVQVFVPSGRGLRQANPFVTVALDALEGKSTSDGAILFRHVRQTEGGRDGPWAITLVIAEFEYDAVK